MTISESITKWLKSSDAIGKKINIELLGAGTDVYALTKTPTNIVETFIDGSKWCTEYYTFLTRKSTQVNNQRISNDQFLEDLETWIEQQEMEFNFPILDKKRICEGVSISSSFCLFETSENDSIYSLTLEIIYRKEI